MHRPGTKQQGTRSPLLPYRLLFPLAALFALGVIPLWLIIRVTHPSITDPAWHGHEMVYGFALAVLAGFLVTRPTPVTIWILTGSWLVARLAAVSGSSPLVFIAGMAFPATLFSLTVPPLLAGAKRRENRLLPAILAALVASDAAWWAGAVWFGPQVQSRALLTAVDLIALLLLLIGGRALRAAAGGHLERQGIARRDHMQRRYELPLAALVGGAAVLDISGLDTAAGILCIGAALLTLVRVIPWQLHRTFSQPHLRALALGYLWLVPGLAIKGIAQLGVNVPVTGMLHGIGIGALGTLTLVMMARTATLRAHKPVTDFTDVGIAALLVSTAALLRLTAPLISGAQQWLLWLAATAWSSAFLVLFVRLWRTLRTAPGP